MDRDLIQEQNADLLRLMPVMGFKKFSEAKRAAVREGLKVLLKQNKMEPTI